MTTQYNRNFGDTMIFSDVNARIVLLANAELTYTVPGDNWQKYTVLFSYTQDANVFVGYNVTAAIPADGTVASTGIIEFKPYERYVKGGDVLHFITPDTKVWMGISLRALPSQP